MFFTFVSSTNFLIIKKLVSYSKQTHAKGYYPPTEKSADDILSDNLLQYIISKAIINIGGKNKFQKYTNLSIVFVNFINKPYIK